MVKLVIPSQRSGITEAGCIQYRSTRGERASLDYFEDRLVSCQTSPLWTTSPTLDLVLIRAVINVALYYKEVSFAHELEVCREQRVFAQSIVNGLRKAGKHLKRSVLDRPRQRDASPRHEHAPDP